MMKEIEGKIGQVTTRMTANNPIIFRHGDSVEEDKCTSLDRYSCSMDIEKNDKKKVLENQVYRSFIWNLEKCGLRPCKHRGVYVIFVMLGLLVLAITSFFGLRAAGFGSLYLFLIVLLIIQTGLKEILMNKVTTGPLDRCAQAAGDRGIEYACRTRHMIGNVIAVLTAIGYLTVGIHAWRSNLKSTIDEILYIFASIGICLWQAFIWRICGVFIQVLATGLFSKVSAVACAFDAICVYNLKTKDDITQAFIPLYKIHEEAHHLCLEVSQAAAPFFLGAEFINILSIIIAAFATAQQYHLAHGRPLDPRVLCAAAIFLLLIIITSIVFISVAVVANAGYAVINAANRLVARVAAHRPISDLADAMHLRSHVLACPLRFEPAGFAIEIHHGISALYLLISALTTVFAYKMGTFGLS